LSNSKRSLSKMRLSLFLVLVVLAGAANAAEKDTGFLFDALHGKTPYHASWDKLMKLVQPTPDWLVQFNKNFDGVAGQMTNVTIDDKPYEISFVCKPTDCGEHRFVVLFDANGAHAFGALGGKGNEPAFFGAPTQAEQEAMAKAVKG
jgi:Inhibitor of vertebrate lysozyme (Ivy)